MNHNLNPQPPIVDGDVIEIEGADGPVTALVLLATETMVMLDLCDDTSPFVLDRCDLRPYRVFSDTPLAAVA